MVDQYSNFDTWTNQTLSHQYQSDASFSIQVGKKVGPGEINGRI